MRKISVVIEFEDNEDIAWVYNQHLKQSEYKHKITKISTGDIIKRCEELEEEIEEFERDMGAFR